MNALSITLGVFALILVLARLKVPLALAIALGAVAIGLLFRLGVPEVAGVLAGGIVQPKAISLVIVTVLLLGLSAMMQAGGQLTEIVSLARSLLRRPALTMAALPALIGLLPMPGGAVFSAPMVEAAAGDHKVCPGMLSAVNYWFRHIWEHWWFLYPGVMLALHHAKTDYWGFVAYQMPLGLFMVVSGLPLLRRMPPALHVKAPVAPPGTKRKLLAVTASIWIIPLVWVPTYLLAGWLVLPHLPETIGREVKKFGPLTVGLLASIVWTVLHKGEQGKLIRKSFLSHKVYTMALLVVSVMVFEFMLDRTGAAGRIAKELQASPIPLVLVVASLPFIAGLVTGLAVGFVGTSFPIVVPLAGLLAGGESIMPYLALAYGFGHLGQMSSPLHLCYVMSNRYFKTNFTAVYRQIAPSILLTAVLVAGYFAFLRAVF